MKKIFVLDTNILISSAGDAIFGFEDNDVVITTTTLEELDGLKNSKKGDTGFNAREAIRVIDSLVHSPKDDYSKGIKMPNGGKFRIEPNGQDEHLLPAGMSLEKPDNRIISSTKFLANSELLKKRPHSVYLVTNDINMKVKARAAGVEAQGYRNSELKTDEIYTGRTEIEVPGGFIDSLYNAKNAGIELPDEIMDSLSHGRKKHKKTLYENEFIHFFCGQQSALAIYQNGLVKLINPKNSSVEGISPVNIGQKYAMYALLSDEFPLVILSGVAGSGKTLLAVAAGLAGTFNDHSKEAPSYNALMYTRNNVLFDEDIGFLPGGEQDKMAPLVRPLMDNLECIFRACGDSPSDIRMKIDDFIDTGIIRIESMAFMRGRSITNNYVIVDEAQNATPKQIRGIVTRAGAGTKVVLLGDPSQIDNNILSSRNNGLVFASEMMKGSPLCAQVTFSGEKECVRSPLAKDAAERLIVQV
ncbi:MAG: PhoH family protein [Candidatus Weimeria sp.]